VVDVTSGKNGQSHGQARRDYLRAEVLKVVERHLRDGVTYADLNVAEVAAEAGISRSTFYAYFVDKMTLLRSWYEQMTGEILDAAHVWWSLDNTVTRDQLREALRRILEAHRPHRELMAATHDAMGLDQGVREAVDTAMRRYVEGLRAHIQAGQAGGFVDPTLPPEGIAYWLQWMAERGLHRIGGAPDDDQDTHLEAFTGIVWNTLYAPSSPRTSAA
jgi:AcrR family transcriptional regulator